MPQTIHVNDQEISRVFAFQGTPVLNVQLHVPRFVSYVPLKGLQEINAYFKGKARYQLKSIETSLYPQAVTDYRERGEEGIPFSPYEVLEEYTATYLERCLVSLYTDAYTFTGGAHGNTIRTGDTFSAVTGAPLPLMALFPAGMDYQQAILDQVLAQMRADPDKYFEIEEQAVDEAFQTTNFYLTPEALVVFFQQYEIAPYAVGIPTFAIPYEEVGASVPGCLKRP